MYTYILIDDEELTRKGTRKKLEILSDQVLCVGESSNGKEALVLIEKLNPDIIITDMNMPVMDGSQLLSRLIDMNWNKPIIVISSYKDFEYLQQAIRINAVDYILKPFSREDIQSSIKKAIQNLNNNSSINSKLLENEEQKDLFHYEYDLQMMKDLILGYQKVSSPPISKKLSFFNETHQYVLIMIYNEISVNHNEINLFIREFGYIDLITYIPFPENKKLGFFVVFISEEIANHKRYLEQMLRNLLSRYGQNKEKLIFGISNLYSGLNLLNESYNQCVDSLNSRKLNDTNHKYYFSETALLDHQDKIAWAHEEEFIFRLESGSLTEVSLLLEDLFDFFLKTNSSISQIKEYCFLLSYKIEGIMVEYNKNQEQKKFSLHMQNIFNTMFSLAELNNSFSKSFTNICTILKDKSVYSTDNTIQNVKLYIQKNYHKNISIEFISSLFYMNRSYLSHLFKEKTGEKFVDYLNNIRIEKAKDLLIHSEKKMYSIAKASGYDNIKYFFRVFKNKTGMTPEQFRNKSISSIDNT